MSTELERDRVISLLKAHQRSMSWLAKAIGTNRQSVQQWLVDGRDPRDKKVWERMKRAILTPIKQADVDMPRSPVAFLTGQIRFAGEVPCSAEWGDPLDAQEFMDVEGQFEHPKRFAAKVVGDSCYPALMPGDITIWHTDMNPAYGLMVLAQRKGDHGCTVKQLEYDDSVGRPRLLAVNPAAGSPEDGQGWGVIARLVGVLRNTDGLKRTWYSETGLRPKHLA